LPGLFAGCQFFLRGEFQYPAPSKEDLTALIKAASGVIITREPRLESIVQSDITVPYHMTTGSQLESCSHFVIRDKLKCGQLIGSRLVEAPPSWIMDCIAQFRITELPKAS
jgi:BRCA1-associated RING domain protein 1